jgi:predicted kinase
MTSEYCSHQMLKDRCLICKAFGNKSSTVYLCIGAPGSGESTWRKKFMNDNPDIACVCPDEFRALFGRGMDDQSVSYVAFKKSYEALGNYLRAGKSVIIDATNMYLKTRKKFIQIARGHGATVEAIVFEVDKPTLLKRIAKRVFEGGLNIPEQVIDDMLTRYQCPTNDEFNKVVFMGKLQK